MKAYVVSNPGGPEVLELQELPNPKAETGKVHIKIKAFGLNRAEAVTRMGGSGKNVLFPKVIGIECVGTVIDCPGGELAIGQTVAAAMGGMGRKYNGSYAEQIVVPVSNVFPIETRLDWISLGAIPETYFTAWGCCFETLQLKEKAKVLVRPGASALGIAITQIVNHLGGEVIGVTRSAHKVQKLLAAGMKEVIVSGGAVEEQVKSIWPAGPDGIVDTIVSEVSVKDDLSMLAEDGRICLAGSLAESYETSASADFKLALAQPMVDFYSSETITTAVQTPILQKIVNHVEAGTYQLHTDSIYTFDQLVEAHEKMDANAFAGKVVIGVS